MPPQPPAQAQPVVIQQPAPQIIQTPPPAPISVQPVIVTPPPVQQQPLYVPVPVSDVQILGITDRSSGKIYRLQVGAYSTSDGASHAFQMVRAAGFEAVQEHAGNVFRVLATGISGANVDAAAKRLGAMGFRQIWVRN
jgi:cell division protein FtsN